MKLIHSAALGSLPRGVRELVRSGVYALYTVDDPRGTYMLVTDRNEIYLLSSSGTIAPGPIDRIRPREAVAFSDEPPHGAMRLNMRSA